MLEIAAPATLGAACALEIAAPAPLGAASALLCAAVAFSQQPARSGRRSSKTHAFLRSKWRLKDCRALLCFALYHLALLDFAPCMYIHGIALVYRRSNHMTGQIDTFGLRPDPACGPSEAPFGRAEATEPALPCPTVSAGPPRSTSGRFWPHSCRLWRSNSYTLGTPAL